ncbi:spore coat protein [Cellulosilyticum sp. I15G10I2]|uniref:spore coat protein n=1 Tax=Cellulosilyticum sp. I15G10I2 TaxID=1892843 RepID=UPI00085CA923|nr:spore coat protein [Cellulosilyticum sp. I15G10I2]
MLQDKTMVNDTLAMIKNNLTFYANSISECENPELREALQQIRDTCECSQYNLFKLAETKGFYQPAMPANDTEVQQVKSQLQC